MRRQHLCYLHFDHPNRQHNPASSNMWSRLQLFFFLFPCLFSEHPHRPICTISTSQFRQLHTTHCITNMNNAPWKDSYSLDPLLIPKNCTKRKSVKRCIYSKISHFRGFVWVAASNPASPSIYKNDISSDAPSLTIVRAKLTIMTTVPR